MKIIIKTVLAACLLATSCMSFAQSNSYGEVSYISGKYAEPLISANPTGLRFIYGFKSSESLSYEGMLTLGLATGNAKYQNVNFSVKENSNIGFLAKGSTKLSDSVQAFGRFGYAYTSLTESASGPGGSASQKTNGGSLAYGAGLNFGINATSAINLDYMVYYNRNGISINGLGIGYQMAF